MLMQRIPGDSSVAQQTRIPEDSSRSRRLPLPVASGAQPGSGRWCRARDATPQSFARSGHHDPDPSVLANKVLAVR